MAATYQTSTTATATSANLSVPPPSGLASGDLWIIIVDKDASTGTINIPSGWTAIGSQVQNGTGLTSRAMYKIAGAGESNVTVTTTSAGTDGIDAISIRVDGHDPSTPIDVVGTAVTIDASSTTIDAPDVTVTNGGLAILWCVANSGATVTQVSGTTEITEVQNGGGFLTMEACYEARSAGAYAPGNFTFSSSSALRQAQTFVVNTLLSSLEQEGFRFRDDSGNEATPNWQENQDTNITWPLSSNLLLRLLINATLDPPSTAYTLLYKKSTESNYTTVPTASLTMTRTQKDAGASTSNTATYTTASVTLTAGRLYVIGVITSDAASEQVLASIATTGGAVSFASLDSQTYDTVATNVHRLSVWWVIPTSTVTDTIVITPNDAATGCAWNLQEYTNPDVTGATPFGTPAKSGVNANTAVSATPGALSASTSHQIAFCGHDLNSTSDTASGTNWSSVGTGNAYATPNTTLECAENTSGTASQVTFSGAGSADRACIAVEIKCMPTRILVSASSNIAAGGEATTALLTAPSGKTTSDFVTGRRWDDENGSDSIDITTDDYTEVEWSLTAQSPAANADVYQFRAYAGANALNTYTVTPTWTIGSHGTAPTWCPDLVVAPATLAQRIEMLAV